MLQLFFKRKNKGFTLIELLVVIAIIGVLASIVLVSLNSARSKGRDTKRVGDVRNLTQALEMYYDANGQYPTVLSQLAPTYVGGVPVDPDGTSNYQYDYCTVSSKVVRYHLATRALGLENPGGPLATDSDINTPNGSGIGCSVGSTTGTWAGSGIIGTDPVYDIMP